MFSGSQKASSFVKHLKKRASFFEKLASFLHTVVNEKASSLWKLARFLVKWSPDVVGASPVGAAPTTSSFPTWHQPLMDRADTKSARQDEKHLSCVIWCVYTRGFTVMYSSLLLELCTHTRAWLFNLVLVPSKGSNSYRHIDSVTHWGRDKTAAILLKDIFKCIFLNENVWISIKISLKFVPKGPISKIFQHWFR